MEKKKNILLAAIAASMLMTFLPAKAADVNNWTDLQQAIVNGTTPINITDNITGGNSELGNLGGNNVTINGGGHDITASNNIDGISVTRGQTLNINNVGNPTDENSKGFNGFSLENTAGTVITGYYGNINVNNSVFSGNKAYTQGGVIDNYYGDVTVKNSVFIGNRSEFQGGAIGHAGGNAVIKGSSFINNSTGTSGGAISVVYDEAIITDSTFTGNSASLQGGAIWNYGTVNIIADAADTTFTGNTANGVSNALYNELSTININATGEHRVVFNDGIDGNSSSIADNIININNTGVKMADGTADAKTDGTVEFNNTVSNNTVNLYDGTLKLGHYEGGTIDVNGTQQTVAESVGSLDSSVNFVVNGGKLSVENDGTTTQNLGNVTLNSDLLTEIALDTIGSNSMLSADSVTANNDSKIVISDINLGSAGGLLSNKIITTDSDILNNITISDDVTISGANLDGKNTLFGYTMNDTTLALLAGASTLAQAVADSTANRTFDMKADETVASDLGSMGGKNSILTINGDGHNITADGDIEGITVSSDQTLNINNVGNSADENSKGFNGFNTGAAGGAIDNMGKVNINNSILSENSASSGSAISNNDTATITITDSTFTGNSASRQGGAIYNYGTVNIIADAADTTFTGNTAGGVSNALYNATTVNLNADGANIVFNDGIDGSNGTININGVNVIDGVQAPTNGTVAINNEVKNNTVNMYNGTLLFGTNTQNGTLYSGTFADSVNFNYTGGTVSLQNGSINSANLGNLTLNSDMDLRLDANLASQTMDTITASGFTQNGHNINISNILITEPTTEKSFSISPLASGMDDSVRTALAGAIQYTGGDIAYSPIYKYSASYDPATALLNFGLYGGGGGGGYDNFNPAVMASPVAAQLGGYLVQLNSYDNAFRNMDMYMLMTKEQRQAMKLRNKYVAGNDADIVFDPTVTQYENKAGWFRPYATFENVSLNNGPKVSNVAYGSFFGAESELYDLGHGWDGMWGVYGGYNGSHQAYNGVSIYQNGGTLGAVGMAYKGNFFTGLTANVGASAGEASSMFGNEDFAMLMTGVASKTGYNWELANGKFIIQPSFLMSYSFINTFDYTNAAGVSINSDPLHAIQLEPGIKFIGNLKNGWQPYLGVSVVWNIMDRTQFQANNVALPNLSIDPFVKYGVGVRKAWGERFTGFFQTYITNGGRNGVGLQAGFRWTLGKSEQKQQKANKTPELPKTKITLNNNR